MPHVCLISTLAPMPGANSALDRPRGGHNPCASSSSMDVHYIASSTLRRLKLKLSTPGKQSVDESQWLRIGLPSESGVYSYDFIVIVWPLGERPGILCSSMFSIQHAKPRTLLDADVHSTWTNTALLATPSCYGQDIVLQPHNGQHVHIVTLGA